MTTVPVQHARYGRGTSTSIITQGVRRMHTTFVTGTEMIEEYDATTEHLKSRRVRHKSDLGAQGPWQYEVGDAIQPFNPSKDIIAESSLNPVFSRHDTPSSFVFRIRNLPYPSSTYSVTVTPSAITVRTSNRKYYKAIAIPDITEAGRSATSGHEEKTREGRAELSADRMRWEWANNTLVIHYDKPDWVREKEARERAERKGMPTAERDKAAPEEAAPECRQQ